jgi:hypothetical protein
MKNILLIAVLVLGLSANAQEWKSEDERLNVGMSNAEIGFKEYLAENELCKECLSDAQKVSWSYQEVAEKLLENKNASTFRNRKAYENVKDTGFQKARERSIEDDKENLQMLLHREKISSVTSNGGKLETFLYNNTYYSEYTPAGGETITTIIKN